MTTKSEVNLPFMRQYYYNKKIQEDRLDDLETFQTTQTTTNTSYNTRITALEGETNAEIGSRLDDLETFQTTQIATNTSDNTRITTLETFKTNQLTTNTNTNTRITNIENEIDSFTTITDAETNYYVNSDAGEDVIADRGSLESQPFLTINGLMKYVRQKKQQSSVIINISDNDHTTYVNTDTEMLLYPLSLGNVTNEVIIKGTPTLIATDTISNVNSSVTNYNDNQVYQITTTNTHSTINLGDYVVITTSSYNTPFGTAKTVITAFITKIIDDSNFYISFEKKIPTNGNAISIYRNSDLVMDADMTKLIIKGDKVTFQNVNLKFISDDIIFVSDVKNLTFITSNITIESTSTFKFIGMNGSNITCGSYSSSECGVCLINENNAEVNIMGLNDEISTYENSTIYDMKISLNNSVIYNLFDTDTITLSDSNPMKIYKIDTIYSSFIYGKIDISLLNTNLKVYRTSFCNHTILYGDKKSTIELHSPVFICFASDYDNIYDDVYRSDLINLTRESEVSIHEKFKLNNLKAGIINANNSNIIIKDTGASLTVEWDSTDTDQYTAFTLNSAKMIIDEELIINNYRGTNGVIYMTNNSYCQINNKLTIAGGSVTQTTAAIKMTDSKMIKNNSYRMIISNYANVINIENSKMILKSDDKTTSYIQGNTGYMLNINDSECVIEDISLIGYKSTTSIVTNVITAYKSILKIVNSNITGCSTNEVIYGEMININLENITIDGTALYGSTIPLYGIHLSMSKGILNDITCSNMNAISGIGVLIDDDSNILIKNGLTGTGCGTYGLSIRKCSRIKIDRSGGSPPTYDITGSSEIKVGEASARTWTNILTSQRQYITDIDFSGGADTDLSENVWIITTPHT